MNRMLGRLEQASERQRRFVADVSHDLRSPLTAQRTQLEVAMAHPGVGRRRNSCWATCSAHVDEMDSLVGDLLFVVTDDERPRTRQPLDLEDVVLEEAARVRRLGGPEVDTSAVSAAPVVGDPDELRRLVRNLVENAVAHAAGRIVLRASTDDGSVVVDVVDDGPGVPAGEEEAVFERFHRGDAARSRRGTGLGLSIARTIAERHGGTLSLVRRSARRALPAGPADAITRCRGAARCELSAGMLAHDRSGPSRPHPAPAPARRHRRPPDVGPDLAGAHGRATTWCASTCAGSASPTRRRRAPGRTPRTCSRPSTRWGSSGRTSWGVRKVPASPPRSPYDVRRWLASLVLAAPGGALFVGTTDALRAFWDAENAALERGDVDAAVEENLRAWVDGARSPEESPGDVREAVAVMQRRAFDVMLAWPDEVWEAEQELDPPLTERLDEIVAPTLVITGGLDVDAVGTAAAAVLQGVPGARVGRVAGRRAPAVDGAARRLRGRGAGLGGPRRGMTSGRGVLPPT